MSKESVLDLNFAAGLDESQRAELLDPSAAFTVLENGRQLKSGGFSKRAGYGVRTAVRTDATTRTAGRKFLSYNGVPCVIDPHQLDAWSIAGGADSPRSRVPECHAQRRPLMSTYDAAGSAIAVAYSNGYYIAASLDLTNATTYAVNAAVVDQASGQVVLTARIPTSTSTVRVTPRLVVVGTNVVCIWEDGQGGLYGSRLSVASSSSIAAGWAARVSLAGNYIGSTAGIFDACGLTTRFAVSYTNGGGGTTRITTATYDPTSNALTQLQSQTSVTLSATVLGLSCDGLESDVLWVAFSQSGSTNVFVEGHAPTTLATVSVAQASVMSVSSPYRVGVGYTGTQECYVQATNIDGTPAAGTWAIAYYTKVTVSGGIAVASFTAQPVYGWAPKSKPFKLGGRVYCELMHDDSTTTAVVLCDITTASKLVRPVAWTSPRLRLFARADDNFAPHNIASVSSVLITCVGTLRASAVSGALLAVEYDFASPTRWLPVSGAGCMHLSGGMPCVYDGQSVAELGFVVPPRIDLSISGTGLTGTFSYTALYETTDGRGNIVWSDLAPVQTIGLTNQGAAIYVRMLSVSWHDGLDTSPLEPQQFRRPRIKIFRTVNGGGLFYLLTTIVNDTNSTGTTYVDNLADATLISHAQAYRSPGVLGTAQPRQNPGSIKVWVEYNGMIVALSDTTMWWTPQHVDGEGIYFTDVCQQPFDQGTAVAAQDGTCFAFRRREIYACAGEPPSDNGTSGGMGAMRRLACDVGSVGPLTAVTALGIFFLSDRGIEILTRAQSVEWIGLPVQDTVAAFPICTAMTVDSAQGLVYFEMAAGMTDGVVTGTGRTLVYDLRIKSWAVDRRYDADGNADAPAQSAALIYTGTAWRYAWLDTAGRVYVEDRTTCLDPGSRWVKKRAKTSWIHIAGLQSEQSIDRIMMLCEKATDHDLTITIYFDYDDTLIESKPFTAAQISVLGRQWLDRELARSTSTAIKVMVEDATPSSGVVGTGEGATWIGLAFPGIPHRGVKRTSAAQRGG